jgi:hypothetical protein
MRRIFVDVTYGLMWAAFGFWVGYGVALWVTRGGQ